MLVSQMAFSLINVGNATYIIGLRLIPIQRGAIQLGYRADEERDTWERKPPAKRPNYDKLGTRSPWRPDWDVVLGITEMPQPEELEDFVDTQRDAMVVEQMQ